MTMVAVAAFKADVWEVTSSWTRGFQDCSALPSAQHQAQVPVQEESREQVGMAFCHCGLSNTPAVLDEELAKTVHLFCLRVMTGLLRNTIFSAPHDAPYHRAQS